MKTISMNLRQINDAHVAWKTDKLNLQKPRPIQIAYKISINLQNLHKAYTTMMLLRDEYIIKNGDVDNTQHENKFEEFMLNTQLEIQINEISMEEISDILSLEEMSVLYFMLS